MNNKEEWWKGLFSDLWLDVQRALKTDEETHAEVGFIEKVLQLVPQSTVLDVPCGIGRHSIELAVRGHQVAGVDIALPLLNGARQKAKEHDVEIRWEHRDMRDLPWKGEFDAAFCFWGSFGYFDDDGNAEFLDSVSSALKQGGRFLLDTHVAETLLPRLVEQMGWKKVGNITVLEERHYDHVSARTTTEWTLMQDGRTFKASSVIRLYTFRELSELLERFGFGNLEAYGSLDSSAFRVGSPRLYLVSTKR
jgi:cyclopropane fatty-acyl-phospholipid synthase-like methyltransferase